MLNVTASTQQHVEVPQIEQDCFFNDWLGYLYFERIVYKNDGYKGENYYGRIKQFCAPQATCLNGSGSTVNKAS